MGCSNKLRPCARWRGGESVAAQVAKFRAGETPIHGNIMSKERTHHRLVLTQVIKTNAQASSVAVSSLWRRPWRPRSPTRKKMANTPSPKLVNCCKQVKDVEGSVAQLWARWMRRQCDGVGARRRWSYTVLGGAALVPRREEGRALESERAGGSEWK